MEKILFVVEPLAGGVFTYITELANDLAKDNEVYVAYGVRQQTPGNFRDYFDEKIKLIEVKNFTREINLKKDIGAYRELIKIYNDVNPDIVHLHSSKAGVLGRLAYRKKKVKLFYTPHGYSFLMKKQSKLKVAMYKCIEYIFAQTNSVTIACSEGELAEALKLSKNAKLVNNGINIENLNESLKKVTNQRDDNSSKVVYTLGRISYQKNPELFNNVALQFPDVKFIWIGDGELRDKLTAPNIEITGWITREKALEYAVNSDIFMLTSLWEGLPMSLLESMYLKKMCIVSDVVGNRDVIKNKLNGYVCRSIDEFVKALLEEDSNNEEMTRKAYEDVMDNYTTKIMSEEYRKIYFE